MKAATAYWPVPRLGRSESSASGAPRWAVLRRLGQELVARLAVSDEPRVWPGRTPTGQSVWNAYDPITGRSINLVSEAELRTWLEDLHYNEGRYARERYEQFRLMAKH